MSELVADCPRCKSQKMTFDAIADIYAGQSYGWKRHYEVFCICRSCKKSTVFVLTQDDPRAQEMLDKVGPSGLNLALTGIMSVETYISIKDVAAEIPPSYLPVPIDSAFREGAACMSIGCFNAGATMFRLCLDLATRTMLPEENENGLNSRTRRNLGLTLEWLFNNNYLPEALRDLASCVRDDGNDGAHQGTISKEDAEDVSEFAYVLLERLYTEPKRLELAKNRRSERHKRT
jgi:hypothetical protein